MDWVAAEGVRKDGRLLATCLSTFRTTRGTVDVVAVERVDMTTAIIESSDCVGTENGVDRRLAVDDDIFEGDTDKSCDTPWRLCGCRGGRNRR